MIALIIESVLFVVLLYAYFCVSSKGQASTFAKWVITLSSMGILFISDKIKLVFWLLAVGVIWLIRYSKKTKKDGLA
jgi:hypothetical protein